MPNILITGISSGIGKYLTEQLHTEYNVFGTSRKDPKISGINFISADLTKSSDIKNLISYIDSKNISLDAVIFNAGVGYFDEFLKVKDKEYLDMLMLNLYSNIILTKKILPFLTPKSKLIYIGSIASKKFMKYGAGYQASKFGLRGFVGALRNELKQKVFLINPQYVDTSFFENMRIEPEGKYTLNRQKNKGNEVFLDDGVIPTTGESVSMKGLQFSKAVRCKETFVSDIYETIKKILDNSESRFEIDL